MDKNVKSKNFKGVKIESYKKQYKTFLKMLLLCWMQRKVYFFTVVKVDVIKKGFKYLFYILKGLKVVKRKDAAKFYEEKY